MCMTQSLMYSLLNYKYNLYVFETYVFLDALAVALRKATISHIMTVRPSGFPYKNATLIATIFLRFLFRGFC
jgi:hypothetical protein